MRTALTDLLKIKHPILSAPMGKVSGGTLSAAVSDAGGLGLVGAGYGSAEWLKRELGRCGDSRIGVGFITWGLARRPDLLDLVLEHGPAAIMFSFGDYRPFLPTVRRGGATVICQVQNVSDAKRAAYAGADVVVAQGTEAGGHGGSRTTFTLVPAVVDAVHPLPVVAAGGVADGRQLAAALMLGASGVLVGTRFYATSEALAHDAAKERIVRHDGDSTIRTRVFDIVRGYPWPEHFAGRALLNRFAALWHGREADLWADLEAQRAQYASAAEAGDMDTAVVFAGENVDLIHAVEPAAAVLKRIVAEAEALLATGRRAESNIGPSRDHAL